MGPMIDRTPTRFGMIRRNVVGSGRTGAKGGKNDQTRRPIICEFARLSREGDTLIPPLVNDDVYCSAKGLQQRWADSCARRVDGVKIGTSVRDGVFRLVNRGHNDEGTEQE